MRADLRKHCISRSSIAPACQLQGRTGSKRDRHEDTWHGSAMGSCHRWRDCGWRAVLGDDPLWRHNPANFAVASGTVAVLLGHVTCVCCVFLGNSMSAPPWGSKNCHQQAHRWTGKWTAGSAWVAVVSPSPTATEFGAVARWVLLAQARVDRRRRERSGDVRSHGNASDVLDF